jgi:tetratricopeptide (TPR) repeat protein
MYTKAIKSFSIIKEAVPSLKDTYYNIALAYAFDGDINACFRTYGELTKVHPEDPEVYFKYCSMIASALNQPNDFLNIEMKPQEIANICLKAVNLDPDNPEPLHTLGTIITL